MHSQTDHFKGKDPLEHVILAHKKGQTATQEIHGAEMPGHISACADAAKETAILFLILWILFTALHTDPAQFPSTLLLLSFGWLLWKMGRSALLGWARLERMHRLIEEERWEIEHHRPQEKEELRALYRAKGFSGKLLDEAVDVLMADDNRLLQVMLQEELALPLQSQEHPLKQAFGAGLGVLLSCGVMILSLYLLPAYWLIFSTSFVIVIAAAAAAHLERNSITNALVWNLAIAALAAGIPYFATQLIR